MTKFSFIKGKLRAFYGNERGDFGIKEIAVTIAMVSLVGVIFIFLRDNIGEWVQMIWDKCMEIIDGFTA